MEREWLKRIREKKKFTQEEMGEYLGIPATTYASYELGMRNPNITNAIKLSKILKVNWTKFYNTDLNEETIENGG